MKLIKLDVDSNSEEMDLFSLFSSYYPESQQQSCINGLEVWTHGDDDSVYLEIEETSSSVIEYLRMSSLFFDTRELETILTTGTPNGRYLLVTGSDIASPYMVLELTTVDDTTLLCVYYTDTETDNHRLAAKLARDGMLPMSEYVSISAKDSYVITNYPDKLTELCIALSEDVYLVDTWRRGYHSSTEVFTKADLIRFVMTADSIINTSVYTGEVDGVPDESEYDYIFSTNSGVDFPLLYCLSVHSHPLVVAIREALATYVGPALVMATVDAVAPYWTLNGSNKVSMHTLLSIATKLASN